MDRLEGSEAVRKLDVWAEWSRLQGCRSTSMLAVRLPASLPRPVEGGESEELTFQALAFVVEFDDGSLTQDEHEFLRFPTEC